MENILEKLVNNSKKAINDGVYEISESLSKSEIDLGETLGGGALPMTFGGPTAQA